ncbi:MAG: hypothetical protein ABIN58_06060 [candidate division WOR-3 bacterium]
MAVISELLTRGPSALKLQSEWPRSLMEAIFGREPEPTREQKRLNDIRGGVIMCCIGIGISIFLYFLMNAVAAQADLRADEATIIKTIWTAGIIPLMIGIGLIINGLFFWKPIGRRESEPSLESGKSRGMLSGESSIATRIPPSVTEETTTRLGEEFYQSPDRQRQPD